MVNMYSMGPMGQMGMYGMNNMYSNNTGCSNNYHQNLKAKYGVGPDDFTERAYQQPYPTAFVLNAPEGKFEKFRFFKKLKELYS